MKTETAFIVTPPREVVVHCKRDPLVGRGRKEGGGCRGRRAKEDQYDEDDESKAEEGNREDNHDPRCFLKCFH